MNLLVKMPLHEFMAVALSGLWVSARAEFLKCTNPGLILTCISASNRTETKVEL